MPLERFNHILADPAFRTVAHDGISGGEPSLVGNLPEYYRVMKARLPGLRSVGVITNCVDPGATLKCCLGLYTFCRANGLDCSIMLSLDGIGSAHDKNRGVPGNFDGFTAVMDKLRHRSIDFITGTTLTKTNVWDADAILAFLRYNNIYGIYGRFRVAEFINRLNNRDCAAEVRNFDRDELYQLCLFFTKLLYTYEKSEPVRNTYRNIIHMLSGGRRIIGCPYSDFTAINIDSYGFAAYCAPKGDPFPLLAESNFRDALDRNKAAFEAVKARHCGLCIHDYHAMPLEGARIAETEKQAWKNLFTVRDFASRPDPVSLSPAELDHKNDIFIIGWYGTETVGDKAILKGVVDWYAERFPDTDIRISSLHPFVTARTLEELGIRAEIVDVYSRVFFKAAAESAITVVGGGPLMELEDLSLILWAFRYAKNHNKHRHIHGCGIGPLRSGEKTAAVREILESANEIRLRDQGSADIAVQMGIRAPVAVIDAPATAYVARHKKTLPQKDILACFLRELPPEYGPAENRFEFMKFKSRFEDALAVNIRHTARQYGLVPHFYAMHNFCVSNDDRDFNLYFSLKYCSDIKHHVEKGLATVTSACEAMQRSRLNLCMRFHSVLFADTLGTRYVAVDYTNGGKIFHYLNERGLSNRLLTLGEFCAGETTLSKWCASVYPFEPGNAPRLCPD